MSTRWQREIAKRRIVHRGEAWDTGVAAIYWNERAKCFFIQSPYGRYPLRMNIPQEFAEFLGQFRQMDGRAIAEWADLKRIFSD